MEPYFFKCRPCGFGWSEMRFKMREKPPVACPRCGSAEHRTDRAREDDYVGKVYQPLASMIQDAVTKKGDT